MMGRGVWITRGVGALTTLSAWAGMAQAPVSIAELMAAPDDPAIVFAFADQAAARGETDAAVNALERYLRFAPGDEAARARLEALYAPAEDSRMVDLGGALEVSGFIGAGFGYDTNPEARPRDDFIDIFDNGVRSPVEIAVSEEDSPFAFVQAALRIETRAYGQPLIADLTADGGVFLGDTGTDFAAVGGRVGPLFGEGDGYVRPYAEARYFHFGEDPFSAEAFVGIEGAQRAGAGVVGFDVAIGGRDHFDTADSPDRSDRDGAEVRGALTYAGPLGEALDASASLAAARVVARTQAESHIALFADFGLVWRFDPDVAMLGGAGAAGFFYDGPDPDFSPTQARQDLALSVYGGAEWSFAEDWSLEAVLSWRRRLSRYDVYDSSGLRGTLRAGWRF